MPPTNTRALKRTLVLYNRRLAWGFVAAVMIGIPLGSAVETGVALPLPIAASRLLVIVFYIALVAFMLVHTAVAVYVFGLPRLRRAWHTLFVYLGYANLIFGLLSLVWYWPFFFIFVQSMIAHVAIGARAALKRSPTPT